MVELKKTTITSSTFLSELFFLPTIEPTSRKFDPKLSKCYFNAYRKYAQDSGYKLKRLNFHLVGTKIDNAVYQMASYFNGSLKSISGIHIDIKLYTIEEFIQELLDRIPNDKWYIKNAAPSICLAKDKVEQLVEVYKAKILN